MKFVLKHFVNAILIGWMAFLLIGCGSADRADVAAFDDAHPGMHWSSKDGDYVMDSKELAAAKADAKELQLKLQQQIRDEEQRRKLEADRIELYTKWENRCIWLMLIAGIGYVVLKAAAAYSPALVPLNPASLISIVIVGFLGNLYCMVMGAAERNSIIVAAIAGVALIVFAFHEFQTHGGIGAFFGIKKAEK